MDNQIDLKEYIRDFPDWPKKGVLFRDITPIFLNPEVYKAAVDALCKGLSQGDIDVVAAVEARGFLFGISVAERLGAGFVPIRKKGKLPGKTESISYDLEYGVDTLEVHSDSIKSGDRILMVDDLLATAGTMASACRLIEKIGGKIQAIAFLIELTDLNGITKLSEYNVTSVIKY